MPGSVVQLNPETVKNKAFSACFMTVDEVRTWGVTGYIQPIGEKNGEPATGQAWYRANWDEFDLIGTAHFVLASTAATEDTPAPATDPAQQPR
jgi:hypothetical protein